MLQVPQEGGKSKQMRSEKISHRKQKILRITLYDVQIICKLQMASSVS